MTTHTVIKLPAQNLEPKSFAPYGEIIRPGTSSAETSVEEPKLTLTNGTPRLWIMDLKKRGLVFADMARAPLRGSLSPQTSHGNSQMERAAGFAHDDITQAKLDKLVKSAGREACKRLMAI